MSKRFVVAVLAACSGRTPPAPDPVPVAVHARATSDAPSIYELGLTLRDAEDKRVGLDAARGSPVLITMFYASCSVACPALIADVKRTLEQIGRDDVRVMLVSFDAARDTPGRLAELARTHGLDSRWTIAAADEPDARELAATIGYKYRKLESGEFFHGATVLALDEDGRPLARSEGFHQRAPLVDALR